MKILLSAYACEPGKGSEPEVGWNWVIELSEMGHEVWVLTRANNRPAIEAALSQQPRPHLHFIYFDLPGWLCFWKKGRTGVHLYYLLWQMGAFFLAWRHHSRIGFEQVRHVTFVSVRQPSLMGLLGIPFFFGPVAGGERAPYPLRKSFPWHGWVKDCFRDLMNALIWLDPLMHLTFATATHIAVTSQETQKLLPVWYRKKSSIHLAIGISAPICSVPTLPPDNNKTFKILYVGNLLYLKGIHLGLWAFSKLKKVSPNVHFTLIGNGPDAAWLKTMAEELKIHESVTWVDRMSREKLWEEYARHDVLLFPSLRDSGGMVVLEALACGRPVVCLDLGGPGVIMDDSCGYKISVHHRSETDVVRQLSLSLYQLAQDKERTAKLTHAAISRAKEFSWRSKIEGLMQ